MIQTTENQGIEFKLQDGTSDFYDPVTELADDGTYYTFTVRGYDYAIAKADVKEYRIYDTCPSCERELYQGTCDNCTN
jgi:hypothetical protein